LQPFLTTLTSALLKMRTAQSFNARAKALVSVVREKGAQLLQATREMSKSQLRVDQLLVDVDSVDLSKAFTEVGLKFKVGTREQSLDKLGTGHQSAVILELYRQLGETSNKFVVYLFEEPDNHLHLTSVRAMADDLELCAKRPNSQVFMTTHSPHMLNMFSIESHLCLTTVNRLTEKRQQDIRSTDKQMRDAVSRSGLTIAEAMLSSKVLLVEGPGDITLFRTLIELQTGKSAEQQDIHIVSGSGKGGVTPLATILQELGANYVAVFDWDASVDTNLPMFKPLSAPTRAALSAQLSTVAAEMRPVSPKKKTRPQKVVASMLEELQNPPAFIPDFKRSELGAFLAAVHQMNPGPVDAVGALVKGGMRKYQPELAKHRIWLWSANAEDILIPDHAAEVVAATELVAMGALAVLPSPQNYRATVINKAHELAHEPERQVRLIRKLWEQGVVRTNEIKKAVKFCL
jgi:predicted ATPase